MKITLPSGREIGDDCKPFIISEIGSNWSSLEDCLYSIRVAKVCGADAVKFQLFDYQSLYGFHGTTMEAGYKHYGRLNISWLPQLKAQADEVGIEFMCSAFSSELVRSVDPYVSIHKLASSELTHLRMLQTYKTLGKPLILSTGAHTEPDIRSAYNQVAGIPRILMYCEAAYPAKWINMNKLLLLKEKFQTLVGFSDHSLDIYTNPMVANKNGACVIEKHANFCDLIGPDSGHSLNQKEFAEMINGLNGTITTALGPSPDEQDMVTQHKRRLIATRDIKAGEKFIENENFGIYRSLKHETKALPPFAIDILNGKVSRYDILAGDGIGPLDLTN